MKMPPPLPSRRPQTSWAALLVSIAAYPGLGQLMQRRWIAGTILTAITTVAGAWLMEAMIAGAWKNLAESWQTGRSDVAGYFAAFAAPAKLFAAVWLVSTADILLAHRRLSRRKK